MRTTLLITKEKIVSVAQKLFIETSFYRTTMKDIARAAKVSRRTLYTHFNSKEDIFNHIVDQKIELIEQKLEQAVRTALPADKRLKLYIKERFNLIAELMGGSQPIKETFLHNNSKIEILRENIDRQEIELLYSILRDRCGNILDQATSTPGKLVTIRFQKPGIRFYTPVRTSTTTTSD